MQSIRALLSLDSRKFRFILLPFAISLVGFVLVYTSLHWLLILKLSLVEINEKYVDYWIPCALSFIIGILYNKRINLLSFRNETIANFYLFVSMSLFACITIIVQPYLRSETGKILKVRTTRQITLQNTARYYAVDTVVLDKKMVSMSWAISHSGKNNNYTNFHGYFVLPILSSQADTNRRNFIAWYCKEYTGTLIRPLDEDEKFESFKRCIREEFSRDNLYDFKYFTRVGNSDKYNGYLKATDFSAYWIDPGIIIFLEPSNIPFDERNGDRLKWIIVIFVLSIGILYVMVLALPINEHNYKEFLKNKRTKPDMKSIREYIRGFIMFLRYLPGTTGLFALNILVFSLLLLSGGDFSVATLIKWGANYSFLIRQGEYWRLITCMFLHAGVLHLLTNMAALLFVGIILERNIGTFKFLFAYLIAGIMGSLTSIWWNVNVVSVGASGAILGAYGIIVVILIGKKNAGEPDVALLKHLLVLICYCLVMGLFMSRTIDNGAHIGGLITGSLIGLFFIRNTKPYSRNKQRDVD